MRHTNIKNALSFPFIAAVLVYLVFFAAPANAQSLLDHVRGYIVLQVQQNGEAWYIEPLKGERWYLGRPDDAFSIMRSLALGITNRDLAKIPLAGSGSYGDRALQARLKGRILLQVEGHGEAWYVFPPTMERWYLGRPSDAFRIMRELGLGISNQDLRQIPIAPRSATPLGVTEDNFEPRSSVAPASAVFGDEVFTAYDTWNEVSAVLDSYGITAYLTEDGSRQNTVAPTLQEREIMRESLMYFTYALDSTFQNTRIREFLEEVQFCRASCGFTNWGNVIFMPLIEDRDPDWYTILAMHEIAHSLAALENIDAFRLICWSKNEDGVWLDDRPMMKDECKSQEQAFVPTTMTDDLKDAGSVRPWYSYGATHFQEDFAESVVAYRVSGAEFRRRAALYPIMAQKYNFIRQYVFNGVEY